MWFLNNKVLLNKDNLAKRKWTGSQNCCFCDANETVDHLFHACPFATIIWRMIYFAYNIPPPTSINNMFGNWLYGVPKKDKNKIRIGISAICWTIWRTRNDIIFNNQKDTNFLQIIHRVVH
jgi:hypothetical protein